MRCIYCSNNKLYTLKSGQLKCSKCNKKFSLKKYEKDLKVIEYFCNGVSANSCAIEMKISYLSVKKRYELYRKYIINYLEKQYQNKTTIEYDEYIYLPKSKKKIKENIFEAHNFITFQYEDKVYNLLMPELSRYKNQFLNDGLDDVYFKEFSKFMMMNKISKTNKTKNLITKFWDFFEIEIIKYKGISQENFFSYLKEIEFKFNYSEEKQKEILKSLYFF
ncbi:MAG: transposase [Thiovulaceae bacterium]|nr:transposase [Sulfurimonadaceae bacterium]